MSARCHLIRLLRGIIRGINWVLALEADLILPLLTILCVWAVGTCGFSVGLGMSLWIACLWLPASAGVVIGIFLLCDGIKRGYIALDRWTEAAHQECEERQQNQPPSSP